MPEQLLTVRQVASRLSLSKAMVYRDLPRLKAKGLQQVPMPMRSVRFRAASLDRMIKKAAERSESLY